jgi:alkylated DNA nucleotide flippase Atl1
VEEAGDLPGDDPDGFDDPGGPDGFDGSDGEPPPVDDFASQVLDVVDAIPPGRVMSYGDIAVYLAIGPGPRQVGRVMAVYGGAVAWWRVIHSDGTPAPGHDSRALKHYLAEGTPLRSARPPVRVDMRRARWPGHDHEPRDLATQPQPQPQGNPRPARDFTARSQWVEPSTPSIG